MEGWASVIPLYPLSTLLIDRPVRAAFGTHWIPIGRPAKFLKLAPSPLSSILAGHIYRKGDTFGHRGVSGVFVTSYFSEIDSITSADLVSVSHAKTLPATTSALDPPALPVEQRIGNLVDGRLHQVCGDHRETVIYCVRESASARANPCAFGG